MTRKISPLLVVRNDERCEAPRPKPDSIRIGRPPLTPTGRVKTFSFGNIWCRDVLLGVVKNHDKLIAHGVHLKLGTRSELSIIPFGQLLKMIQVELKNQILLDQQIRESIKQNCLSNHMGNLSPQIEKLVPLHNI